METHAIEFVDFFSKKEDYKLMAIFTRANVDDGVQSPENITASKFDYLIKPFLIGDFDKDAKTIVTNSPEIADIYYLNSPTWLPAIVILKKQYPKIKIIVRSGGNDLIAGWIGSEKDEQSNLEDSRNHIVNLINQYVDKLIVNSKYSLKRTVSIGVNPAKIVIISGGVNCKKFKSIQLAGQNSLKNELLELVTTARLIKFKGFEYNLRTVKEVIDRLEIPVRYTIIGDGPEKLNLKKQIKELGIENSVEMVGAISFDNIPKYLENKHIFLHLPVHLLTYERGSSYIHTETMGRSLCEAAASSLPAIASNVGGISEIVQNNITGFIVKEKDYLEAADKIILLAKNRNLMIQMRKSAREFAEKNLDFKKIFNKYEDLFK